MSYRNGNYAAFYVTEPFQEGNLGAHATKDFVYYNLLRDMEGSRQRVPIRRLTQQELQRTGRKRMG